MPAHAQIPDWQARGDAVHRLGIYNGRQFVGPVMLPALRRMGIDRRELPRG